MLWRSSTIEKLLRLSLDKCEFESILFWTDCLCKTEDKGTGFRHIVIGSDYLYTTNPTKWELERECHLSQILNVRIVGDVAEFLRCKITRTYNHMKVLFIDSTSISRSLKKKNERKIKPSTVNESNNIVIPEFLENDQSNATRISSQTVTTDSSTTKQRVKGLKQLDFYLKDRNVFVFKILHEAVRACRENCHGFKSILKQLMNFHECSNDGLKLSDCCIAAPNDTQANRRRSIIMSFLAREDDLLQIMPFFKSTATMSRSRRASKSAIGTTHEALEHSFNSDTWITNWLDTSKRISIEMRRKDDTISISPIDPVLLMYNQIVDVQKALQRPNPRNVTDAFSYLPMMIFIVEELSFWMSGHNLPDVEQVEECMQATNSTGPLQLMATKRMTQMELILIMVDAIRLFVEDYNLIQFDKHQHQRSVPLSQWYWNQSWRRFVTEMIEVVTTPPKLWLPCRMKRNTSALHPPYSSVLERCLCTELDSLMIASNENVQESEAIVFGYEEVPCFCSLYSQLVSDLNSEVTCILFEIFALIGPGFEKDRLLENAQWIDTLVRTSLEQSVNRDPLMLTRLSSHASAKLHLLCCWQQQNSTDYTFAPRIHIEDMVRTLFVIDWLTFTYPELIEPYRTHGSKELISWFRPRRLFSLLDTLGSNGCNLSELRLAKCALVALSSRIYERVTGKSKASWAELDHHIAPE